MNKLEKYIKEIVGLEVHLEPFPNEKLELLPLYIKEGYNWGLITLGSWLFIVFSPKEENEFSIIQIDKISGIISSQLKIPTILLLDQIEAYNRKRLIESKIAFVVPNKQLFIPGFILDIRETGFNRKKETKQLSPTAQLILLLFVLDKYKKKQLESLFFKELAEILNVKPMEISRATTNLREHNLITINGDKEKSIQFNMDRYELWNFAMNERLLINPVLKRIFVDKRPNQAHLKSNTSALPEYTDMNPSKQKFYAIEKTVFYALQRNNELINVNDYEGEYCIELWKYNPQTLAELMDNDMNVVDPLSLYLSLKDDKDARIEMALEQIIEKHIW